MDKYIVKLYTRALRDLEDIYVIIYRVLKEKKEVHIVTVRYVPSNF